MQQVFPWAHQSRRRKRHLVCFSRFLQGSLGDRPTERPTDHATRSVTIGGAHSAEAKFCYRLRLGLQQVFLGAVDSTDLINFSNQQLYSAVGLRLDSCIVLNIHNTVFASNRSAICNRCFPGPTRVLNANCISIASEFSAGLTIGDRPTDRPTNHATRSFIISGNTRHLYIHVHIKGKEKEEYLYSAICRRICYLCIMYISKHSGMDHTVLPANIHHACLDFVSVNQMAPFLTEVEDIQLQLTTHLSTPKG